MSKRTFYKTIIQVEVLSEEPYDYDGLENLHYDITKGHCSGLVEVVNQVVLSGPAAAEALLAQGSDPEFFLLDDQGNDLEED